MVARKLLIVTAVVETAVGLTLLVSPPLVARLLLAASLDGPAALIVGRMTGAALLLLGVAYGWRAEMERAALDAD